MMISPKVLHLLSGGMDSTVMLYDMIHDGAKPRCIGFYYGQRHVRELDFARATCRKLDVPFETVGLSGVFSGSFLTGDCGGVVVPNRNAVMLHIAAAKAISIGAEVVTFACNYDDRKDFPDCRPEFLDSMNATLKAAELNVEIRAVYSGFTKWQIVQRGNQLGVRFDETWSCYAGSHEPCGECGACKLRQEAMR